MKVTFPVNWPDDLRRLLVLAIENGEGWTAQRVQDDIEAISSVLIDQHLGRLLTELAGESRPLAALDASVFLGRLLDALDLRATERWLELEQIRQWTAPVAEPDRLRIERLVLEPHATRYAPRAVEELKKKASGGKAGSAPSMPPPGVVS